MMPLDVCVQFLRATGADDVGHSGRSLFDHLFGTYMLLQEWASAEHVCRAGLFHSVYGTQHFRPQTVPLHARERVRVLIGEEAEYLAYAFCAIDRPRVLLLPQPETVPDRFGGVLVFTPKQWGNLRVIEAANLQEQGETSGRVRWLRAAAGVTMRANPLSKEMAREVETPRAHNAFGYVPPA